MIERRRRIEQKRQNQRHETQRLNKRMKIEVGRENESRKTQEPQHGEEGADLQKLLIG